MATNQMMDDLMQRASAQLGGGYNTAQQPQQYQPAQAAKYTHNFDNTPVNKNGQTYNGTHTMKFEAPKNASAQWGSLADMKNHFAQQAQNDPYSRAQQPQTQYKHNPLLRSVVDAAELAMNRTVIPMANIRNSRALLSQLQDNQYKQGHLSQMGADRTQRQNQFISNLAHKKRAMDLQAQQFDQTHYLNMQNAQYARNAKNNTPKDALEYGKLFDATYAGNYDEDTVNYLRENQGQYDRLKADYIQNGGKFTPAQYNDGGWFGFESYKTGGGDQNATAQEQQNETSEFPAWLEKRQGNTPNYDNTTTTPDHTATAGTKWWDDPKYKNNPTSL